MGRAGLQRHAPNAGERVPAPFVVGVARSGTTLLRLQLDAHPDLAIPPETYFAATLRGLSGSPGPTELLDALSELPHWGDLGVSREELAASFAEVPYWSPAAGLRAYYSLYAARRGKQRWGDKTPANCLHMDFIAELLPEARFIHIIRDGRDVAASLRGLPFAPGDGGPADIARTWQQHIRHARDRATAVSHYHEVRYERLVTHPEPVLREVCAFLELPFDPIMLRAHEFADERLEELTAVRMANGTIRRPESRRRLHGHTRQPPDPSRTGRWSEALSQEEVARFEAVAGDLLAELGYPRAAGVDGSRATPGAPPAQAQASPEICCIVMSCGNEPGLEPAVRSILDQDEPVEVVVVNSAGEGARARIERAFPGLRVWESEARLNPGAARNAGLRLTRAPYVSFLAADCVAQPGWARARLRRHRSGATAVASAMVNATPGHAAAEASFLLLFRNRMPTATGERLYGLSYERATLERLGGFREDLRTGEDTELNARLPDGVIEWAPEVVTGHAHPEAPPAMLRQHFRRGRRMAGAARDLGRSRVRRAIVRAAFVSGRESADAAARLDVGRAQRALVHLCARAGAASYACGALAVGPESPRKRVARYVARVAMPSFGPSLPRRRVRLLAVLPVRDEIDELPACLASLAPNVDGVIALDDGSGDGSADWLAERREVLELIRIPPERPRWDEAGNRRLLLEAALRHGAEWIVAVDADERLEPGFRARAERVIARGRRLGFDAYSLRMRELWERTDRYRADGVFGRKVAPRLFAARPDHEHDTRELHGYKAPLQTIRRLGCFPRADLEIYHRGMMTAGERAARRARYEELDPDARWQPNLGYAYLTDESGLRLRELEPGRGWRAWWQAAAPEIATVGGRHARRMRRRARLVRARVRRAGGRARRVRRLVRRAAHRLRGTAGPVR